jgi:SulP family sulfate permease
MPAGGSMSASSLAVSAGAASRTSLIYATITMIIMVMFAAPVIGLVAMPALAALLIIVGFGTIKPGRILAVAGAGPLPATVMAITFVLTLIIPLQYAVLIGVGISAILFVAQEASGLELRRINLKGRRAVESTAPAVLPPREVVILQPYGAIFFASAATLNHMLPQPDEHTTSAVVILRLRGADDAGATFLHQVA